MGLELQRRRSVAGLSQEKLASRAGMTRTHYQQLERGAWKPGQPANPSLRVLVGLAQALGVEVGDLLPSVSRVDLSWFE
nr:helix-turn-helix transcriptional regulator [Naumannella cuiyingiana]